MNPSSQLLQREEKPSISQRDQWRERIAEQARSGLSIKQFCKNRGIAEHSFYGWRKRLRESEPVRFALVDRTGGPARPEWNLELTLLNGERLCIGAGGLVGISRLSSHMGLCQLDLLAKLGIAPGAGLLPSFARCRHQQTMIFVSSCQGTDASSSCSF